MTPSRPAQAKSSFLKEEKFCYKIIYRNRAWLT